ncbi:MAG: hypothetical protein ABL901_10945 [Hyphomicrobiaceae bacterium]
MSAQVKMFTNGTQDEPRDASAMAAGTGVGGHDDQAALDELRAQYEQLRGEVAAVVAKRTHQAAQLAQAGTDGLRSQIRSAPGTSLALAVIAGGLIAVLVTNRRAERTWSERVQDTARDAANRTQSAFHNADINDLASRLRRSAESSFAQTREQAAGVIPGLERLAQSLSTMDSSTFTPAIEKGTSWLKALWDKLPSAPALTK